MTGEALLAGFAEQFPGVEREPLQPFFTSPEPTAPPPATEPAPATRRRWWQGAAGQQPELAPSTPGNLIAAYESQRSGGPASSGPAPSMPAGSFGPMPTLPEQPSMYDVSRSLRLMLEAPRKLVSGLRRASEAVGGAGELVNGLQDPQVRRNAMRGLYHAAVQQEAEGGPLAGVGPVVRAAVRFAESTDNAQPEAQQTRRIQVKAAVRRAPNPVQVEELQARPPAVPARVVAPAASAEPVRRTISVRRVEMAPPEREPEPPAPDAELPRAAPVRRIAVTRPEREGPPNLISLNGNGKHE